jgi:hypothetical protein
MYVVVQRVTSPVTRETGINAFLYLHPGRKWTTPPDDIPGGDPGRLVRKSIAVVPNNNRVQSNIEIVAPDDIDLQEARTKLLDFADRAQFGPLPWAGIVGSCSFKLHMVPRLLRVGWAPELQALATAGAELVVAARQPRHLRAVPTPR